MPLSPPMTVSEVLVPNGLEPQATADMTASQRIVAIAANFTAEPLQESLRFWGDYWGWSHQMEFAPFDQIFQQLLTPGSLFGSNQQGINIVLLRFDPWLEMIQPGSNRFQSHVEELIAGLRTSARRTGRTHLLGFCPLAAKQSANQTVVDSAQERIRSELADEPGVLIFDSTELLDLYPTGKSPHLLGDAIGGIPYTPAFFTALGTYLTRRIQRLNRLPYKVIVLDCDNTLWQGIAGEDGPLGVELTDAHCELQARVVQQIEQGMLVCLCSKNNEADVWEVFENHPEMPLRREHVVAHRINWNAKSVNLQELAQQLELGLDSFVFLDDSPLECAQVRRALPEVLTVQVPLEDAGSLAKHLWAFDRDRITREDRERTTLYRQNLNREKERSAAGSLTNFLAGLELKVSIQPVQDHQIPRVSELTQRTNQFNATTIRRTELEIAACRGQNELHSLAVEVSDRFGDYGLVGVVIYRFSESALVVDSFLVSCRALGRTVEYRILAELGKIASTTNRSTVVIPLIISPKNQPIRTFLETVGSAYRSTTVDGFSYALPVAIACQAAPPAEQPETVRDVVAVSSTVVEQASGQASKLAKIATDFRTIVAIQEEIAVRNRRERGGQSLVAPRSPIEQTVAAIWQELLYLDRVGLTDDFFRLGGNSLQAAIMLTQVQQTVGKTIPLSVLFNHPVLSAFVEAIEQNSRSKPTPDSGLKRLATLSERTALSPIQQRFWSIDRAVSHRAAYNVNARVTIDGPLNPDAFQAAWAAVVARQESLRTYFEETPNRVVQTVLPELAASIAFHDLQKTPELVDQRVREEASKPFDLFIPPLWRAAVEKIGPERFVLHWSIPHILMDESSRELLLTELWTAYSQIQNGKAPDLPALAIRYSDFSVWANTQQQDAAFGDHLAFWKSKLTAANSPVLPPHPKPRPGQRTFEGGLVRRAIPETVCDSLADLAQSWGVTPFTVYLAAFQTLLYRYTGETDICVGTAVSNRPTGPIRETMGCFVNTVAIRCSLHGEPSFQHLLERLRNELAESMQHGQVALEKIMEEVRPERIPGGHPFFQSVLIYHSDKSQGVAPGGIHWQLEPAERIGSKMDFAISIEANPRGTALAIEYSTDLYDNATIERIASHYLTLLAAMVADPSRSIVEYPILTATERELILETWNATRLDIPEELAMQQLVERRVAESPAAIAFVHEGKTLSFAEWNRQANRLADYLVNKGIESGTPVALFLDRALEMPIAMLGVVKAGGCYVPFDPSQPKDRLEYMLRDTGTPMVLTTGHLRERLPDTGAERIALDQIFESLQASNGENPPCRSTPESLFALIYTSGSTGKPKGVKLHHRGMVNLVSAVRERFHPSAKDTLLAVIPYTFDPHTKDFWCSPILGAKVVIASQEITADGNRLKTALEEHHATIFNGTPTMLRLLLEAGWQGNPGMEVLSGGEAMSVEMVKEVLPRVSEFWNVYGPTETSVTALAYRIADATRTPAVGKPLPNVRIYILDPRMMPVPIGCPGEIYIGGVGVTHGYWNQPGLTAERFIPDPFTPEGNEKLYKTGDLGRYLADGNIEFLGRIDFQVKIRGFRIELGEIEQILEQHPGIQQAIAMVRKNRSGIDVLNGYFIPKPDQSPTPVELRQWLLTKLPDYMVPTSFVAMKAFPETTNRKVDRKALPEPDPELHAGLQRAHEPPINDAERALQPLWEDVFGIKPIGVTENFYDLGGHSVLAAVLMSKIETLLGHQLPLEALFLAPTIRGLGNVIQEKLELGTGGVLVPLQTTGDHPPLFLIAGAGGHVFAFHKFARLLGSEFNVYGMKAIGVDGTEPPLESIPTIAKRYLEEIVAACPDGPYVLGGYSVGGMIAYELALQMQAAGLRVSRVIVFDLYAPGYPKRKPLHQRIYLHCRNFLRLGWRKKGIYLQERFRRIRQRILFMLGLHHAAAEEIPGMDIVPQDRLKRVWGGLVKAHESYWPAANFDGALVLIGSSLIPEWVDNVEDDPLKGWSHWTSQPVRLYEVPAPHMEVFRDEYHSLLIPQVREILEDAKAELDAKNPESNPWHQREESLAS